MSVKTGLLICVTVCFLVFSLPLNITSIVLSRTYGDQCDFKDRMGLDVQQYLLIGGIVGVVMCSLIAFSILFFICSTTVGTASIVTWVVVNFLFAFCWFIVGAVILFRSNLTCIAEGTVPVIYALVMWCLAALSLGIV